MLDHRIDNVVRPQCRYSPYRPRDLHIQKSTPRNPEVQGQYPDFRCANRSKSKFRFRCSYTRRSRSRAHRITYQQHSSGDERSGVRPPSSTRLVSWDIVRGTSVEAHHAATSRFSSPKSDLLPNGAPKPIHPACVMPLLSTFLHIN